MEASSKYITKDRTKARCLGPTMVFEEVLDYVARFAALMGERPFFTYAWINEVTHNDVNSAGYADKFFRRHLESLRSSGVLNHTLLLFYSDHGMRFGDSRASYIGKFEDRQPFAFVVFPQWFLEQNPEASRSLRVNQFRLTTPFDLHATLVELLHYPNVDRPQTKYGRSLLHKIPEARTCAEVHIGPHWCVCNVRGEFAVTDMLVRSMADQLVSRINLLVARKTRKCAQYKLVRVVDVTALQVTPTERAHNSSHYWVAVQVSPGNNTFEGTVSLSGANLTALDDISHINYALIWAGA
ncbi:hypothetical protein HPB49_009558 [Dermacentor silvarum]|uniref:Uncharacterized protein n=2 Tax=Dermacentor silvarum TaxID=543639 RepID=A0ACB8CWE5_DERSI|nr:hypothetical protein HPB49_009558 [Dermacentor silvarum]